MPVRKTVGGVSWTEHLERPLTHYPQNRVFGKDFEKAADTAAKAALDAMPHERVAAIKGYLDADYKRMNEWLRASESDRQRIVESQGEAAATEAHHLIENAREALRDLPRAPEDMVLFRGARFSNNDTLNELASASEITSDAFLSTTRDPGVTKRFMSGKAPSALYRIRKHSNGALVTSQVATHDESEVLFPPGARFRVVGRQRVSPNHLLIDLEEIDA